jgi:hypothetical protein
MNLKKLYLAPLSEAIANREAPIVPPRGYIFLGGQPNVGFYCERILVVGESVRATHLFVPDPKAPEDSFHRAIDVSNISTAGNILFDPSAEPVVRVQNDSDVPQEVSVSLIGPSGHDKHSREYIHTLWPTNTLSLDLHRSKRFEVKPCVVGGDATVFTVRPPIRGRAVRLCVQSNSKMDLIVDGIQSGNCNHMIGISAPIEMFQGEGVPLNMGVVSPSNRIVVILANTSKEERWVELYVEFDTDIYTDFEPIQPQS